MSSLIVTLDGPAGAGKSTVARTLARRLGVEFLDTGAMYRGIAARALDHGIDPATQPDAAVELARRCVLRFDWTTDPPRLHIADLPHTQAPGTGTRTNAGANAGAIADTDTVTDSDITDRLRDPDVTRAVSDVASLPGVREVLVQAQRRIGREHPRLVTEGRDQGSVVFPQADAKFYLDASPEVRARRRSLELARMGKPADPAEILRAILERDHRDTRRRDGPLICPEDARRIDTSAMSLEEVVALLESLVRHRLGARLGSPAVAADPCHRHG